jgi:hypothetical protein
VLEEPLYLLRDHDRDRGRAELFARVAAAAADGCRQAEAAAGLSVDDAADLHRSTASPPRPRTGAGRPRRPPG